MVELDLVELVAALDAANVAAGGHLLAPETRRVRDIIDRQGIEIDNLIAVHVRERDLGGRDPPEVLFSVVVHVLAELR